MSVSIVSQAAAMAKDIVGTPDTDRQGFCAWEIRETLRTRRRLQKRVSNDNSDILWPYAALDDDDDKMAMPGQTPVLVMSMRHKCV